MDKQTKNTLWSAANALRGQMDAAEYKHIVLGLIFIKFVSDRFEAQRKRIIEEYRSQTQTDDSLAEQSASSVAETPAEYIPELEERDYYTADNVFWVPEQARWELLKNKAKQRDIGSVIDEAIGQIEKENSSLKGKLDKRFGRTQLGEGKLGGLIDLISTIGFGDEHRASDVLGEVYEYFLGQFASAEGKKGGEFYTPASVVKILVEVLSPTKGRVYDPCCGSGGMFVRTCCLYYQGMQNYPATEHNASFERYSFRASAFLYCLLIVDKARLPTGCRLLASRLPIRAYCRFLRRVSNLKLLEYCSDKFSIKFRFGFLAVQG